MNRYRLHESGEYWQRLDANGEPVAHHRYTRLVGDAARQTACSHALMDIGTVCAWCGIGKVPG